MTQQKDDHPILIATLQVFFQVVLTGLCTFGIIEYQSFNESKKEITKKKISLIENLAKLDAQVPAIQEYWKKYSDLIKHCRSIKGKVTPDCKAYLEYNDKLGIFNSEMESNLLMVKVLGTPQTKQMIEDYMKGESAFWNKDRDGLGKIISSLATEVDK